MPARSPSGFVAAVQTTNRAISRKLAATSRKSALGHDQILGRDALLAAPVVEIEPRVDECLRVRAVLQADVDRAVEEVREDLTRLHRVFSQRPAPVLDATFRARRVARPGSRSPAGRGDA